MVSMPWLPVRLGGGSSATVIICAGSVTSPAGCSSASVWPPPWPATGASSDQQLARLLQPKSVGNLLRPIATEPHAAPSTRTASRAIGKHQRAGRSLTRFHVREVFFGQHPRQCFSNREEQRLRRSPAPCALKAKRSSLPMLVRHQLSEPFIPGK